jgi:hypothetical protein
VEIAPFQVITDVGKSRFNEGGPGCEQEAPHGPERKRKRPYRRSSVLSSWALGWGGGHGCIRPMSPSEEGGLPQADAVRVG